MKIIPENAVVLMVGPSGAGKSTITEKYFQKESIFESDAIRIELFGTKHKGDIPPHLFYNKVFAILNNRIEKNIKNNKLTVVDATNLNWRDRKIYNNMAEQYNRPCYYIVYNRPLEEKIKTQGWREGAMIGDKSLVEAHHDKFIANELDILSGDNGKAIVIDARTDEFKVDRS